MTDIYDRMQSTSSRLLKKYSQGVINFIPMVPGANDWDALTEGTPIPLDATASGVQYRYISELITSSDIEITAAVFGQEPSNSDRVSIDGVKKDIIGVKKIPSAGVAVAYKIFVKG